MDQVYQMAFSRGLRRLLLNLSPLRYTSPMAGKPIILIVEDEKEQREVLAKTLADAGYGVLQAPDGKNGLIMASDHQPDLLMLDIKMPEMTGFEMLKRLRKQS